MRKSKDRPFKKIGQHIAKRRKLAGFSSQEALAEAAGVAISSLKDMERGISEGRFSTRSAIAKALGCKIEELGLNPYESTETHPNPSNLSIGEAKILEVLEKKLKPQSGTAKAIKGSNDELLQDSQWLLRSPHKGSIDEPEKSENLSQTAIKTFIEKIESLKLENTSLKAELEAIPEDIRKYLTKVKPWDLLRKTFMEAEQIESISSEPEDDMS